jgi:hypothetical protein
LEKIESLADADDSGQPELELANPRTEVEGALEATNNEELEANEAKDLMSSLFN